MANVSSRHRKHPHHRCRYNFLSWITFLLHLHSSPMTTMAWLMRSQHHVVQRSIFTSKISLPNTRYFTALKSLTASNIDGKDGDNSDHSQHDLLESKLRQLATLNGGKAINPRSPQQVSQLLYNGNTNKQLNLSLNGNNANNKCTTTLGPTDKATLQRIISASDISNEESAPTEKQIQAAKLVLACREIYSNNNNINSNGKSGGVTSESFRSKVISLDNAASTDETNETNLSESTSSPYINLSTYEQMVMDLFPNNIDNNFVDDNMSIDPYWKGPLLSLTRSTSRSIVRQLHVHCPMGYDPSAKALSSLTSSADSTTTTTTPVKRTTSPLLSYIRHQKVKRPDCIMLVRVGDFYETYGVDAILLVENCGLNAMAGRAKAGCPKYNIQATLDGLTRNGYRVAVYEEWNGVGERPGGDDSEGMASNGKLKTRFLQQVVSSASPTYMYGLRLKDDASAADDTSAQGDDISSSSPGRSYVGVIETANAGYTLVEVSAEERTAVVSERLTAEAVSCRLVAYPPADPMFHVPADGGGGNKRRLDRLPFSPWRQQSASSSLVSSSRVDSGLMVGKVRMKTIPQSLVVSSRPGLTDIERAKQTIVSAFLRLEDDNSMTRSVEEDGPNTLESNKRDRRMVHDDFVVVSSSTSAEPPSGSNDDVGVTATHPLHLETATQLGLIPDPAIPPLISALLPDSAPAASRRFLRRWLLIPPPPDIADAMSQLVKTLMDDNRALPSSNAPPLTGKVISLIRAAQASAAVYCEILSALDAASEVLLLDGGDDDDTIESSIVNPLMKILHHDTGIDDSSSSMALRKRFLDAMKIIEGVVSTQYMEYTLQNSHFNGDDQSNLDSISNYGEVVPPAFFERNEAIWRGRVKPNKLENAHRVPLAARHLAEAIAVDFYGVDIAKYDNEDNIDISDGKESTNVVVQDIFNNILAIKTIPKWIDTKEGEKSRYFHPHDRNGKILRTRYTTARVQEALSDYVEACSDAQTEVETVLAQLSYDLVDNGHLSAILQASHFNLILKTAAYHAASSNSRGWNVATIYDDNDKDSSGHFNGLWPYWMDKSESVENTFDLDGLFLITAPNMSGKSTLMRSAASAALLTNAGLCAPVSPSSSVRRFDFIFVRGASADVPTENKSAFGAEMGDVSSLLRSCGEHSLVFVDEIGRGTSPKDGTSLAGAILETMSASGMSGMFATHLHGILKLPFTSEADARIRKKKMGMADDSNGKASWTYKIEDGECTNSLALLTASKFGLPDNIIKRAEELSKYFDTDKDDYHNETRAGITTESTSTRYDIHRAGKILEDIAGNSSLCSSVHIPAYAIPPPSFERTSCVYILQIGDAFYVGETDSLSKRLSRHRASKGKELIAIAIKIDGGKSAARHVESLATRQMATSGFPLISISDGTTISRRPNN